MIFGHDSIPLKTSPFQVSFISVLRTVSSLMDGEIPAFTIFTKKFPICSCKCLIVVRYFSFVEQTVLVVFPDYSLVTTQSPKFFFICLQMVAFEYFQYDPVFGISE